MTVRSYLRSSKRPLVFVPVYVGYEHVFEGRSYISELSGGAKKRESLLDLLRAMRRLRGKYGRVYLSFGEPIFLEPSCSSSTTQRGVTRRCADVERPGVARGRRRRSRAADHDAHQRGRRGQSAQPARDGAAVDAEARDGREGSARAARALREPSRAERPTRELVTVTELSGREIVAYGERAGLLRASRASRSATSCR